MRARLLSDKMKAAPDNLANGGRKLQHCTNFDAADEYRPEPPPPLKFPHWKDGSIRIGIHTSIAGDIASALEIAHGLGANALQIFSSSPRMWDAGHFAHNGGGCGDGSAPARKELGLGPLVIHDNYLINLASPNPVLRTRSVQAFHQEIVRAVALGRGLPGVPSGQRAG